jgi:predicted P-loop ATPase/GTPase
VVNERADVPEAVREGLPVGDAVRVGSLDELNAATGRRHVPALRAVGRRIRETDRAVVESYGDIARPLQGTTAGDDGPPEGLYDAVAAVEPGRVRVYDGGRYVRACDVASTSPRDGRLERRVGDVLVHLDPAATVDLPALGSDERDDPATVARRYAGAYDALVEAARG